MTDFSPDLNRSGFAAPFGRKSPRMALDISVRVYSGGTFATLGRGHDVSRFGMALYTPVELQNGIEIQLTFVLPYSRVRFGIRGIVRNRQGFRYGIEFKGLTPLEFAELDRVTRILTITN